MAGEVKGFLFAWIGKNLKVKPEFTSVPHGSHRFNFKVKLVNIFQPLIVPYF